MPHNSLTHSFTHSLTNSLTHSITGLLTFESGGDLGPDELCFRGAKQLFQRRCRHSLTLGFVLFCFVFVCFVLFLVFCFVSCFFFFFFFFCGLWFVVCGLWFVVCGAWVLVLLLSSFWFWNDDERCCLLDSLKQIELCLAPGPFGAGLCFLPHHHSHATRRFLNPNSKKQRFRKNNKTTKAKPKRNPSFFGFLLLSVPSLLFFVSSSSVCVRVVGWVGATTLSCSSCSTIMLHSEKEELS